jgi:hypothetical protein
MDMSNKSLALLLTAAIVISLAGTIISLNKLNEYEITGFAAGQVNITLSNLTQCTIDTNVDFGSGTPTSLTNITTHTDNSATGFNNCVTNNACGNGTQINNSGNTNLNVSFTSVNASVFLGDPTAPNAYFNYRVYNGTLKSGTYPGCTSGTLGSQVWVSIAAIANNYSLCTNLSAVNGADIIAIGYDVLVNESTPRNGTKANSITVYCGQV